MEITPKVWRVPGAERLSLFPGGSPFHRSPRSLSGTAHRPPAQRLVYDSVPAPRSPKRRTPGGEAGIDVRIEKLNPIHVARIRHVGPYSEVGACFERLFRWVASIGVPTGRVLTLSYDNPENVAPERLRSDACVELRTGEEPPPGARPGPAATLPCLTRRRPGGAA